MGATPSATVFTMLAPIASWTSTSTCRMSSGSPFTRGGMGYGLVDALAAVQMAQSWTAAQSNYRAQLVDSAGTVVQNVPVDQGGNFTLRAAPTGTYMLRVGNDTNSDGTLGQSGEAVSEQMVTVGASGDTVMDSTPHHVP